MFGVADVERGRAAVTARQRRARCDAVGDREAPKGGEAGASEGGAKRSAAKRESLRSGEPPAMGAERPSRGGGKTGPCRLVLQAKRAATEGSEGGRDRHRNGEDRAAGLWSRAGRSRARRNRARRPVRRTGRAPLPSDLKTGRYRAVIDHGRRRLRGCRDRRLAEQEGKRSLVGGVGCDDGKSEARGSGRWRHAKRGGDKPSAGRRADALRMEEP